jgi:hypothetical protein
MDDPLGGGGGGGGGLPLVAGLPAPNNNSMRVTCSGITGWLQLDSGRIVVSDGPSRGQLVSPSQFERMAGRSAARKWRYTIRIVDEHGACACVCVFCVWLGGWFLVGEGAR